MREVGGQPEVEEQVEPCPWEGSWGFGEEGGEWFGKSNASKEVLLFFLALRESRCERQALPLGELPCFHVCIKIREEVDAVRTCADPLVQFPDSAVEEFGRYEVLRCTGMGVWQTFAFWRGIFFSCLSSF